MWLGSCPTRTTYFLSDLINHLSYDNRLLFNDVYEAVKVEPESRYSDPHAFSNHYPNILSIRFVDPSDTVGARRTVENILHILVEHCTNKLTLIYIRQVFSCRYTDRQKCSARGQESTAIATCYLLCFGVHAVMYTTEAARKKLDRIELFRIRPQLTQI